MALTLKDRWKRTTKSISQVARELDLPYSTVYKDVIGGRTPSPDRLYRYRAYFCCTMEALYKGVKKQQEERAHD